MIAIYSDLLEDWSRIRESDCPLIIEERPSPLSDEAARTMLAKAPFNLHAEGSLAGVIDALVDEVPTALSTDIAMLGARFMDLMRVEAIRLRIEGITGNACKKVHADYTDVRLITTYAGPGTDFNAVERGCVSITPLQIDLTHRAQLPAIKHWMR